MNKRELINALADRTGFKKKDVRKTVESFIDLLQEQFHTNEKVSLKRLGTFIPVYQCTRPVRNPRTGEPYMLVPRNSIKFRPGDDLVRMMNSEKKETPE